MDFEENFMDISVASSQLFIADLPDSILLHIFQYLPFTAVCQVSKVCTRLNQVSSDELLWRSVFLRHYELPLSTSLPERAVSWRLEFKRLFYHTPALFAQEMNEHKDEVLHVSFSHDGTMFATCSKDGLFMIWSTQSFPVSLLFKIDMRSRFGWHFTQFSQFNETDTCLLVSGVYQGSFATSGEIAIFDLQNDCEMQSRVTNKPYDVFGTWYDNEHLLSGTIYPTGGSGSVSAIWISKASQEVESEVESVSMVLYRFHNKNSSSVRLINVADIERARMEQEDIDGKEEASESQYCDCEQVCDNFLSESSLLDKLLCKEISEEEFDIENEDIDDLKGDEEEEEKMACEIDNTLENRDSISGKRRVVFDSIEYDKEPANMKTHCAGNRMFGIHGCSDSEDMRDSGASSSRDDIPSDVSAAMSAGCSENSSFLLSSCHVSASGDACVQYGVSKTSSLSKPEVSNHGKPVRVHSIANSSSHPEVQNIQTRHDMSSFSQYKDMTQSKVDSTQAVSKELCCSLQHLEGKQESKNMQDQDKTPYAFSNPSSSLQAHSSKFTRNSNVNFNSADMDFQSSHLKLNTDGASNSSTGSESWLPFNIAEKAETEDNVQGPLSPICFTSNSNRNNLVDGKESEQVQTISKHKNSPLTFKSPQCSVSDSPPVEIVKPRLNLSANPKSNISVCRDQIKKSKKCQTSISHHALRRQKSCQQPPEKLLIYTWGTETYTPHKIGIKRMKWTDFNKGEVTARRESMLPRVMENMQNGAEPTRQDNPDHSIEMHGHIVGLRVAPDQRYLYVNCRPWPKDCVINDPQDSPPLAQEIEISKIDLQTFEIIGPVLRSHKAFTHGDDCFFLSLDVSENFVVSGAEDKQGYLWDRHYCIPLYRFPHSNVVNCVALNPANPEMLVTVSDDFSIKVWTSRHLTSQHRADIKPHPTVSECR